MLIAVLPFGVKCRPRWYHLLAQGRTLKTGEHGHESVIVPGSSSAGQYNGPQFSPFKVSHS